jgi:hypothetical protein
VQEFGAAISLGSKETMDNDEVECLLANMIYKVRFLPLPFLFLFLAARQRNEATPHLKFPCPHLSEYLGCLCTCIDDSKLMLMVCCCCTELNERLHCERTRHRRAE